MNLLKQSKKRQQEDIKKQQEIANKLVEVTKKLYSILEEEELQVYECEIVVSLLNKRFDETAKNYTGKLKLKDLV